MTRLQYGTVLNIMTKVFYLCCCATVGGATISFPVFVENISASSGTVMTGKRQKQKSTPAGSRNQVLTATTSRTNHCATGVNGEAKGSHIYSAYGRFTGIKVPQMDNIELFE